MATKVKQSKVKALNEFTSRRYACQRPNDHGKNSKLASLGFCVNMFCRCVLIFLLLFFGIFLSSSYGQALEDYRIYAEKYPM